MDIEKYNIYASLDVYNRRLDRAKDVIKQALTVSDRWYVSWSGGKDSTALAHLVNTVCPGIDMWSEKDDCDYPGEMEYVESTARKYGWNVTIESPAESLWDELVKMRVDICEDIHSTQSAFSRRFFYSFCDQNRERFDGVFLGLRAEESTARRMNFRKRGHVYELKNGFWVCNPLSTWKGMDVFSYLITNEIPILDVYFKTKFIGDPTLIRKAWYLPGAMSQRGAVAWLRYYYPELYAKLVKYDPKIKSYT